MSFVALIFNNSVGSTWELLEKKIHSLYPPSIQTCSAIMICLLCAICNTTYLYPGSCNQIPPHFHADFFDQPVSCRYCSTKLTASTNYLFIAAIKYRLL